MKTIDSKGLYEFVKNKTGSTIEALETVQLAVYGYNFYKAFKIAEERHGGDLMPCDCVNILEEVYGKRMTKMKPKTIIDKVTKMMQTVEPSPDTQSIKESVDYYLND